MKKFSEFLIENNDEVTMKSTKDFGKLTFEHKPTGTKAVLHHQDGPSRFSGGAYDIGKIESKNRGKGGAHKVMSHITKHADKHNLDLTLTASPLDKNTDQNRLESLYSKHGFRKTIGTRMIRTPQRNEEFISS